MMLIKKVGGNTGNLGTNYSNCLKTSEQEKFINFHTKTTINIVLLTEKFKAFL